MKKSLLCFLVFLQVILFAGAGASRASDSHNADQLEKAGEADLQNNEIEAAIEKLERALDIRKKAAGPNSTELAGLYSKLGLLYYVSEEWNKSEESYRRALEAYRELFGIKDVRTAEAMNSLGEVQRELGRYSEAKSNIEEALAVRKELLGDGHISVAVSLNNLGLIHADLGDYKSAAALFEQSNQIKLRELGSEHPDVAAGYINAGGAAYLAGDYASAENAFLRALSICEKIYGADHPYTASGLHNLGAVYKDTGRYGKAEDCYKRALEIRKKFYGPEHPVVANTMNDLGALYFAMGRYKDAEPLYTAALESRKKRWGDEHPEVAVSLNNLAALNDALGRYDQAEKLYMQSLSIREKLFGGDHPSVATTLNNIAGLLETRGDYRRAERFYKRALEIRLKAHGPEHPLTAAVMNNLAMLYDNLNEYDKAEPLYLDSLAVRKRVLGPEHPEVALVLNNLSEMYRALGEREKAFDYQTRALKIRRASLGEKHPDVAQSLNNLSQLYQDAADLEAGETLLNQALEIWKEVYGTGHPEYASGLNNLAEFYKTLGVYEKAAELYKQSLKIRTDAMGGEHPDVALILNNLASLYQDKKEYAEAERLYLDALRIWEANYCENHLSVASALNNLAGLYFSMGDYGKAETYDRRALEIRRRILGPDHPDVGQSLQNIAGHYLASGDYERASDYYNQAFDILIRAYGDDHPVLSPLLNNMAVLNVVQGREASAFKLFLRSQNIDANLVDQVMGFTSERQKLQFVKKKEFELHAFLSLVLMLDDQADVRKEAFEIWGARKGIVLEMMRGFQNMPLDDESGEAGRLLRELNRTRTTLSKLFFEGMEKEGRDEYKKRIEELKDRARELEARLSRIGRAYMERKRGARVDLDAISACLPAESVFIDIGRIQIFNFKFKKPEERWMPAHYIAFVLHAGSSEVSLVDLGDAELIDAEIEALKTALMDLSDLAGEKSKSASINLYQRVFQPLLKDVGSAKELFISPDGNLNLIPFEVFLTPEGKYLIEDRTLHYLTSGAELDSSFTKKSLMSSRSEKAVLVGDPDFDFNYKTSAEKTGAASEDEKEMGLRSSGGLTRLLRDLKFEPLAGTRKEVAAVGEIIGEAGASIYLGRDAGEDVFKNMKSPPVIHLATHGFFLEDVDAGITANRGGVESFPLLPQDKLRMDMNPLRRSGLALAGANVPENAGLGILTAEKVLTLNLQNVELVVLSACQTGIGEVENGEGVYGLRRAFFQAGAGGLVMSMWPVPDNETKELMINFYRNMYDKKLERAEALRSAALQEKKIVEQRYGHSNPLFWGSFIFVGGR